jgi:predicted MFS family arabinose efflux permease
VNALGSTPEESTTTQPSEWRAGGALLFTAMISAACLSLPIVVLGTMMKPLSELYGWSRASIASAIMLTAVGTLIFAPIVGHVVDRVGPRRVGLVGLALMGLAICGIGLSGPSIASWYVGWGVFALMQPAAGFIVWVNGVASRFNRQFGLALGIMFLGTSLLLSFLPRVSVAIIAHFGWRAVYFGLGGFVLFVALPLAARFFRIARPGPELTGAQPRPADVELEGMSLRETLATRHFWQLALGVLIASAGISVIYVHLQPMLTDVGASAAAAAAVVMVVGPASLIGRFGTGYLVDRLPSNLVTAGVLLCPAIAFLLLIGFDGSIIKAATIAALGGVAQGAESNLLAFLARRYFGRRAFSAVYGFVLGAYSVGFGFAPTFAGWVFDRTHSYQAVILPLAISCLVGAALIATLGKARYTVK